MWSEREGKRTGGDGDEMGDGSGLEDVKCLSVEGEFDIHRFLVVLLNGDACIYDLGNLVERSGFDNYFIGREGGKVSFTLG